MKTWHKIAAIFTGTVAISAWGVTPLVFAQASPLSTSAPTTALIHGKNFAVGTAGVAFGNATAIGTAAKNLVSIALPGSGTALSTNPHTGITTTGVDVTVSQGGLMDTLANGYHYPNTLTLTNVTTKKGTPMQAVIHGKNFTGATATVKFGGTTTVGTVTKNSVTIALPASSDALTGNRSGVNVTVTDNDGLRDTLANGYHYATLPVITNVTQAGGKNGKPLTAIIHGKNFTGATASVQFGGTTTVGTVSKNSVTIALPASSDALSGSFTGQTGVDVTVNDPSGLSDTVANGFHYSGLPQVTKVTAK